MRILMTAFISISLAASAAAKGTGSGWGVSPSSHDAPKVSHATGPSQARSRGHSSHDFEIPQPGGWVFTNLRGPRLWKDISDDAAHQYNPATGGYGVNPLLVPPHVYYVK